MNKFLRRLVGLAFLPFALAACGSNAFFQDSRMIPEEGWRKNDFVTFDFDLADTSASYNVLVDVRNNDAYPFRNFWLFVHVMMPDSAEFSDTLDCTLADSYGKWLGKSSGSMYHVPVAFRLDTKFSVPGKYHFDLVQGMRMDTLPGISEIGIRILKNGEE